MGFMQPESAGLQPSLDVDETHTGILVQVEAMTGDDEGQLSCAEKALVCQTRHAASLFRSNDFSDTTIGSVEEG